MALSGSIVKNVGNYWQLKLSWSATQSITGNYSDVTAKLYWLSTSSNGSVYSSATKTAGIEINDGGFSTKSASGMAQLSGEDSNLLHTVTKRINHNADGTAKFSLDGYFDVEVTLSGTYYGRIDLTQETFTLNTIPRASSVSSSASWTAGNKLSVSIARASSSFTHTVRVYVGGTLITTKTGVGSSVTIDFGTGNKTIFQKLAQGSSVGSEIEVDTYNGSTKIGTKSKTGTVTAPDRSTTTFNSFDIGATISGTVSSDSTAFDHKIQIILGGTTYTIKEGIGAGSWSYSTADIATELYKKTPDSNTLSGVIRIYTYYEGVQVRSYAESKINAYVKNSNPVFAGGFTYKDTNSKSIGLTGDATMIVQGVSNMVVTLPLANKATAMNGATMSSYLATVNGKQVPQNYSTTADITFDVGVVTASTDVVLSVKAIDSRGNATERTMIVKIVPYTKPKLIRSAKRKNNFESETVLKLSGSISPVSIGNSQKNILQYVRYRTKLKTDAEFGGWVDFEYATAGATFTATDKVEKLDNTKSFDIEFYVEDKLGETSEIVSIASGEPIVFIDVKKRSVGVNKFPTVSNGMEIKGTFTADRIDTAPNKYASAGGGLDLHNSDIMNANSIFMNDIANSDGEGLQWVRSNTPSGSTSSADHDTFRVLDGTGYLNSKPVFTSDNRILWQGAYYMHESQIITPSKPISQCPNGWVLVWSDFDPPSTANNSDWNYTFVPKEHAGYTSGGIQIPVGRTSTSIVNKYIYVTDTQVKGNAQNDSNTDQQDVVLRYVLAF